MLQSMHELHAPGFWIDSLQSEMASLFRERINVAAVHCPIVQIIAWRSVKYLLLRTTTEGASPEAGLCEVDEIDPLSIFTL